MKVQQTAGRWDRNDWPVYFAAANFTSLESAVDCLTHMLAAVNEIKTDNELGLIASFIAAKKHVLIDSGVYWLATQHARANDLSMNTALSLAPSNVDGFSELFDRYVEVNRKFGDEAWGYIEIDQGGRANKMKTRARLEKLGLRPIPVYHPINDGWDYFDYLAQRYDRICLGNVVMADSNARRRLIATAWERRRKYPHLWIHALGITPGELTTAFPMNSCDSSTWIAGVRWGSHSTTIATQRVSNIEEGFTYALGTDPHGERGNKKAQLMCGYDATVINRTMRNIAHDQRRALGADIGMFDRAVRK